MKKRLHKLLLISFFFVNLVASAQRLTEAQYIERYKYIAIQEMHRTGIPASITLAQGILESASGNSKLTQQSNNHFGIKCQSDWQGEVIYFDDDAPNECFRKYETDYQSFADHSDFLVNKKRYALLFQYDVTDYVNWAKGLKQAGYATNPQYADLLIGLIQRNQLYEMDLISVHKLSSVMKENGQESGNQIQKEQRIKSFNGIKYVVPLPNETLNDLATLYEIPQRRLKRYNDWRPADNPTLGDEPYVFLQPKRRKSVMAKHKMLANETLRDVSQRYGIKLKLLHKRNDIAKNQEPKIGQTIDLNAESQSKNIRPESQKSAVADHKPTKKPTTTPYPKEKRAVYNPTPAPTNRAENPPKETAKTEKERPNTTAIVQKNNNIAPKNRFPDSEQAQYKKQFEQQTNATPTTKDSTATANTKPNYVNNTVSQTNKTTDQQNSLNTKKDSLDTAYQKLINQYNNQKNTSQTTITTPTDPNQSTHTIAAGDTLFNIAKRYKLSVEDLKTINNLQTNTVKLGTTLKVKK